MFTTKLTKNLLPYLMALAGLTLLFSLAGSSATLAQNNAAFVRQVRAMEADEMGIPNPAGLAFSSRAKAFHVVEARGQGQPTPAETDIIKLTPFSDRVGSVRIVAAIQDPINIAFDGQVNRLLIFQSPNNKLIEVLEGPDGNLDPTVLIRHDARHFGLGNPQGMTVDPVSGHLFILDAAGPRIVRVEPEPDGSFDNAVISEVDLQPTGVVDPRGLAFDPTNNHLHLLSPAEQRLFELTQTGQVVTTRNLSEFELGDPRGMVFAPSGDQTDDPLEMSLYLADRGLGAGGQGQGAGSSRGGQLDAQSNLQSSGEIVELSFVEPAAVEASAYQSSLVNAVNAWQWSPPSPDTAGITYLSAENRLLVSDSEVNEMSIYRDVNLFEITLSGDVLETGTTLDPSNSNEPTGTAYNANNGDVFISDDNKKEIYVFKAGSDGVYGTGDDIVTNFDTLVFDSGDPEGVAFDSNGQGTLFIVDGVNREVYIVTPGSDGVFNGVPPEGDDQVTHFDTASLGVEDPEGIAFNTNNGNLYIVGKPETNIAEVTTAGNLVQNIDISAANADKPAGLAYAPGSLNPTVMNIYIVQRGVDNNSDPKENDGMIYEMTLQDNPDAPPVANDDSASTPEDTLVTIDVAANDTDPDGNLDPTSANTSCANGSTGCTDPANGSLFNNSDGTFDYTPNPGFTGNDSFVYEICDTDPLCDTATVNITVSVNNPPVANDDSASTTENTLVTIDVAANDTDPDGNLDPTSANTACPSCADPTNGALVNNGDGTFTYTPSPGFNGSDSFVYELCDTDASCDTATVSITVNPSAPTILEVQVAASSDDAEEQESGAMELSSSDLELVREASNQTVGMRFNRIDIPQGATISKAYIQFQTDETGSEATSLSIQGEVTDNALTFVNTDGNLSSRARTTAAVSWTPAPWMTKGEAGPDQQTPDIAAVIQEIVNRPGWASGNSLVIIITGSGKRVAESYNGDQVGAPLLHLEYTTRPPNNDPPVANDDAYVTNEDTLLNVSSPGVLGNDNDTENDPLTAVLDAGPANGTLTLNPDGSFTYTPNADFNGADSFTYHAHDGAADSNVATVSLTVNPVNDAPVAVDDAYTTDEDTPLNVAVPGVLTNDSDVEGNSLTAILVSNVSNGTLSLNADGSFTYIPDLDFVGTDSFTYKANDSLADSNNARVTLTVNAVTVVTVAGIDPITMQRGTTIEAATLTGSGFVDGASVTFENGSGPAPKASNIVVAADGTSLTATVTAKSGGPKQPRIWWDVRVTNPDASSGVLVAGFSVTP